MASAHTGVHQQGAVKAAIANYRSRSHPEPAVRFAKEVVGSCGPMSPGRAKSLLWACSKLAAFGISVGLDPIPPVLLHPACIERFVVVGANSATSAAKRTLRTNLRFVAAQVTPGAIRGATPLPRERAKLPYSDAELSAYLALADAQPTRTRRMRAAGLISLGAGAGLMGADLRHVRGTDICWRSGGMVVEVVGRRARVVPVLLRYHELLHRSATFAGTGLVIGGTDPGRHNVTTPLVSSLSGGVDLARLDTGRLRVTWLAACAETLGIKAFMTAAGISCSQRLGDLVATLADVGETDAVSLLGGSAWPAR